jgi:hypothetical protein
VRFLRAHALQTTQMFGEQDLFARVSLRCRGADGDRLNASDDIDDSSRITARTDTLEGTGVRCEWKRGHGSDCILPFARLWESANWTPGDDILEVTRDLLLEVTWRATTRQFQKQIPRALTRYQTVRYHDCYTVNATSDTCMSSPAVHSS